MKRRSTTPALMLLYAPSAWSLVCGAMHHASARSIPTLSMISTPQKVGERWATNAAALLAAAAIASVPHEVSAIELPGTLLAADYQSAESALKADLKKAKKVDPAAEAQKQAQAAAKAESAKQKAEAAALKKAEAQARREAQAVAKADAAALKEAEVQAKKQAQAATAKPKAATPTTKVQQLAAAKPSAPKTAASVIAAQAATSTKAAPATPTKTPGSIKDLSSSTKPSDVAVAVRSGVIDLKAQKLPSSIGAVLPFPVGPIKIDLAISINKATEAEVNAADVVVTLPKDLVKASKLAVGGDAGLVLDVPGIASGRFDLDLDTPRKGEADIVVTSKTIPKLPVQKTGGFGRTCYDCGNGEALSDWYVARNLGNGVTFYGNVKTGVSQFEVPKGF